MLHCCLYVVGSLGWAIFVKCLVIAAPFCLAFGSLGVVAGSSTEVHLHLVCAAVIVSVFWHGLDKSPGGWACLVGVPGHALIGGFT